MVTPTPVPSTESGIMQKVLSKNWKTTAIGLVIAVTGFVVFSPETFGGAQATIVVICKYITAGGLAALGITAKDFNVTGGTNKQ